MKKMISTSLVISAALLLVGCGGGSSDTADSIGTNPTPVATGTAFYIDSEVIGVNYTCGAQEGVTGANGEFTFEVGQSCTFYLGDMKLRDVNAGLLVDGESVYETDVAIARILQSLDSDGNPDNGITIASATVQALADEGITSLPTTDAEMDEMLAVIAANGGTEVSEEDAAGHMFTTLLGGKTFYVVGQEISDATDIWGGEATFNADLTQLTYVEAYGSGAGETEIAPISIDGSRLVFGNDTDGSYTVIGENKGDYIEITDYYIDGTIESQTRLYFDKTKADAYVNALNGNAPAVDLEALIVGKTVYQKCGETVDSMIFQANGEILMVENGEEMTVSYRIDGNVIYTMEDGQEKAHTFVEATADHIKFRESNGGTTTFYFTSAAAQAAPDSDCGGEDSSLIFITEAMLNGKVFYFHVTDSDGASAYIKYSFYPASSIIYTELVASDGTSDAFDLPYSLVDGKIVIQDGSETKIIVAFEMNNDRWMVQKEGDGNAPLTWHFSKPADFPASL